MSVYDDEIESVFLSRRFPVARQPHECRECGETILPGHRYVKEAWLVDGDFFVLKRHMGGCPQ